MITIIADGPIKQKELQSLCSIYLKRISTFKAIRVKVISITSNFESSIEKLSKKPGHKLFLMCEEGKVQESKAFAEFLRPNFESGDSFTFVIGPPQGFSNELKSKCNQLSLSAMTFPHEMAQMLLLEQIYRSYCLFSGKNYHK